MLVLGCHRVGTPKIVLLSCRLNVRILRIVTVILNVFVIRRVKVLRVFATGRVIAVVTTIGRLMKLSRRVMILVRWRKLLGRGRMLLKLFLLLSRLGKVKSVIGPRLKICW